MIQRLSSGNKIFLTTTKPLENVGRKHLFTTHRQRTLRRKKELFVLIVFCISTVVLVSNIVNFKVVANVDGDPKNHEENDSIRVKQTNQITKSKQMRQRICILAGPHKTGTSSIQTNLYRWSKETVKFADAKFQPLPKPIVSWIWPVPLKIAEVEHSDTKAWEWTPSKVFYPMMEVLRDDKRTLNTERTLYQKFTPKEILGMYRETINTYWQKGYDIAIGSEAMDIVVKVPEGPSMIRNMSAHVLPDSIDGDQVTVVVVYRTPKIKHLISMWHQNCNKPTSDNKFYQWITTTDNTLGALDALGMVDMFLNETDWNVALIDLDRVTQDGYDISNFVACRVMGEECQGKRLNGLNGSDPIITNVRSDKRPPNVSNQTLDEMDIVLQNFDCNYQHILGGNNERLKMFYPEGMLETLNACEAMVERYPRSRDEMRQQINDIAVKYGVLW